MNAIIVLILRILLVALLYGFVIFVLYSIWRLLKTELDKQTSKSFPKLSLLIVDSELPFEKTFNQTSLILGRDASADVQINDTTISSRHAKFSFQQNQWWVEDLDSTNGTFLNQIQVEEPMVITSGDDLRCGRINIQIKIETLMPQSRRKI